MSAPDRLRQTNVADLLDDGIENQSDIRACVTPNATETGLDHRVARSTTDPLEINFAEVQALDKIDSKYLTRRLWDWAWFWFALPPLLLCIVAVFASFSLGFHPKTTGELLFSALFIFVLACSVSYWPYVLLRRRKRPFWRDT